MKMVFLSLIILAAGTVRADSLEKIKADNPSASAYEILERLYETSTAPAQVTDFDKLGSHTNLKCAGAQQDAPTEATNWYTMFRYETVVKAIQGHGPLFPGTPAGKKTIILGDDNLQYKDLMATTMELYTTATDLVDTYSQIPNGMSDPYNVVPYKLLFRKNQNYIAVKEISAEGTDHQKINYGYCWRK